MSTHYSPLAELSQQVAYIMGLDRMIHERSRLAILAILRHGSADYNLIANATHLSKGNLSNHLSKLEAAGLVRIDKRFENKKPLTTVSLTPSGRSSIERYFHHMSTITETPIVAQKSQQPEPYHNSGGYSQ